jgi:pimeloyl-ACP methyl ester carboxylesterase
MQKIYCLSGLGADHRIFQNLDLPGYELVFVPWAGYEQRDDLQQYARKMSAQIEEEAPILTGVSFGGMLAAEIARIRPVKKVIVISSAKNASELPPANFFLRFLVRNGLIPVSLGKVPSRQIYDRFGVTTDVEKALLMSILQKTDNGFTKWALKAMLEWSTRDHMPHLFQLHGTVDKIISPQYIQPDHWIEGGTHFMIYQQAEEISALISSYLAK